jgi:hypothetical protein
MNKSCQRCGYNAQFNWSGLDVCGSGCYEILMLQLNTPNHDILRDRFQRLLGSSVQGIADCLGDIVKDEAHVEIGATTYSRYYPASETWVIELNRYHRDNLIWLFNAIGYPSGNGIPPFNFANTGDWVGEIHNMLDAPEGTPFYGNDFNKDNRPNNSLSQLKDHIESWLKNKKSE